MINDTSVVHAAFFALFGDSIPLPKRSVPVDYARKSAENFAEGQHERYPLVVIQDYAPEDDPELWSVSGEKVFLNARDTDGDGVNDTADEYGDESMFVFRYDVSQTSKDFIESQQLLSWFYQEFPRWGTIEIDGFRYSMVRETRDVMRSDGVFEYNHEFKLTVNFDAQKPKEVALVTVATTNLAQTTLPDGE